MRTFECSRAPSKVQPGAHRAAGCCFALSAGDRRRWIDAERLRRLLIDRDGALLPHLRVRRSAIQLAGDIYAQQPSSRCAAKSAADQEMSPATDRRSVSPADLPRSVSNVYRCATAEERLQSHRAEDRLAAG
jgi:hypothetical protein